MKNEYIKIIIGIIIFNLLIMINTKVNAATMGLSINKSNATVGDSFTVTISGINGRVNISGNENVEISPKGSQFVDGSLTISGTAKKAGTGTVTITPVDVSTTAAEPEEVTAPASKSITIKEKEQSKPVETPETTPTTTNTKTTTKSTTTTKKIETKNVETPKEETKVQEEIFINLIKIIGIKENDKQEEIQLSPEFEKNVYNYTCNVPFDVEKIELQKDAGDYTSNILVNGLDELKEGENIITLKLAVEDHEAKTYTIKAIKEKKEEEKQEQTIETIGELENKRNEDGNQETAIVSMPVFVFVILELTIIIVEALIIKFVPWSKIFKIRK